MREEPILPPPQVEERRESMRRLYIRRKDVEKYGYTEGCEGCKRMRAGMSAKPHTQECRTRMEEAMKEDEEGRKVLEAAQRRNFLRKPVKPTPIYKPIQT